MAKGKNGNMRRGSRVEEQNKNKRKNTEQEVKEGGSMTVEREKKRSERMAWKGQKGNTEDCGGREDAE